MISLYIIFILIMIGAMGGWLYLYKILSKKERFYKISVLSILALAICMFYNKDFVVNFCVMETLFLMGYMFWENIKKEELTIYLTNFINRYIQIEGDLIQGVVAKKKENWIFEYTEPLIISNSFGTDGISYNRDNIFSNLDYIYSICDMIYLVDKKIDNKNRIAIKWHENRFEGD